jgi:uncharacterized protein YndB with AHSA1/START domain
MNEAADDTTLQITRLFDASPERVFDAWLEREQWQAWIGPEGMNCDVTLLEPHVGGRYRITMRLSESNVVPVAGVFKAIDRPEKLIFTWGWEGDLSRTSLITLTLRKTAAKTELTLRQEGLRTASNRDDHVRGWSGTLNKLGAFLAA